MNLISPIRHVLTVMSCASMAYAQTNQPILFREATPPAGVVKGFIRAGDRRGVLIAGGNTAYSNDTFTVTTRGHKVKWQVLEVTDKGARFARETPDSVPPLSPPPDCTPNFGSLVMMLEDSARAYKAASTGVLKEKVMAAARDQAKAWCSSNQVLCVKGSLSDLTMVSDSIALLRLKNVDCGKFKAIRSPNLYVHSPFEIKIPLTRDRATGFKAGNTVILCGRPVFRPGSDIFLIGDGLAQIGSLTSFRMLSDTSLIGALNLTELKCDIFDPKAESVPTK